MADQRMIDDVQCQDVNRACPHEFIILHRALLKRQHISPPSWEVEPAAFMCRPANDFDGLSVAPATVVCIAPFLERESWFGVARLHSDNVLRLSLSIAPTSEDHANITGIPRSEHLRERDESANNYDEIKEKLRYNTAQAEYLAGVLAKASIIVWWNITKKIPDC